MRRGGDGTLEKESANSYQKLNEIMRMFNLQFIYFAQLSVAIAKLFFQSRENYRRKSTVQIEIISGSSEDCKSPDSTKVKSSAIRISSQY